MHWINNVLFAAAVAAAAVGGGSAMAGEENKNMNELPTPYVTVEGIISTILESVPQPLPEKRQG